MVSKIAVMALVAVVAVPILLGYGMNIQTESYTDWDKDGDEQNLTTYLSSIIDASKSDFTAADLYLMNSQSFYQYAVPTYPIYEQMTATKTPIKMNQGYMHASSYNPANLAIPYANLHVDGGYDANNYEVYTLTYSNSTTETFTHIKNFYWETSNGTTATVEIAYFESPGIWDEATRQNVTAVSAYAVGSPRWFWTQYNDVPSGSYANIAKGYRLNTGMPGSYVLTDPHDITSLEPTGICDDMVLTFNLDSVSESNYRFWLKLPNHSPVTLAIEKKTIDGVVNWSYTSIGEAHTVTHPLYYNPDISSNTYQLYLKENTGGEFRYVGAWSDTIAPAPALITYPFSYPHGGAPETTDLYRIDILGKTPVMRIDSASVASFAYSIIQDTTFSPSDFKTNPATKLTYVKETGSSIVFGGHTYSVSNGKITVDSKTISVNNLVFDSVFTGSGYDNRINGTVVSSTVTPSTITFNGDWVMQVNVYSQKSVLKEDTHWVPGKFAWQGVDLNFKIVGLLTSVGVFITLGVYGHKSGMKIWPLLLVCLGAGAMFFFMI